MNVRKFMTSKGPIMALLVTLVYGILVFFIYFTGYQAMPNRLNRLPVTIVNQDQGSQVIAKQLKTSLSKEFKHVQETSNLSAAKRRLNGRQTYLVVDIPKNFTHDVQSNQATTLHFYVNESNPTSVVSSMKSVANTIGTTVQQKVIVQKSEAALTQSSLNSMQSQLQQQLANAPASMRSQLQRQATQQVQKQVHTSYAKIADGVNVKIHRTNRVKEGLNYSLGPFFANLGLYLASLIGTLLIYSTYAKFARQIGRWKAFADMQLTILVISVVASAVVKLVIMQAVGIDMHSFMTIWLGQFLVTWASFELNGIFVLLLGQMGSAINIFLTMIQVVSCGGMVPVVTMSPFFKLAHYVSPMYYGAQIDFNLFYGGSGTAALIQGALILALALLLVNIVIVCFRKKQSILNFADYA